MTIGEFCTRDVAFARRDTTVAQAAQLMRHYHVGSLVVVDETDERRVPVGMVTDRDLVVEVVATDLDSKTITVGDIMSAELLAVPESADVLETMQMMRMRGVRRAPVTDAEGALAGIISVDDLLEIVAEELAELAKLVGREQAREARSRT